MGLTTFSQKLFFFLLKCSSTMSEQERIQDCLRKEIRSLLISTKDGLTPQQLEKEYLLMVGNHLPLRILGYRSTMELVLDMPDVVSVCPCGDGTVILKGMFKSLEVL